MARRLDDIADDIRFATSTYEGARNDYYRAKIVLDEARERMNDASDLMDKYRDELLEAVNGDHQE